MENNKNLNQWLRLVEQDVSSQRNSSIIMDKDGNEYDIRMSQKIGDEWYFGFANNDLEKIIPKYDLDSALYSIANNCLIRLWLDFEDDEMLEDLVKQSIRVARGIQAKNNKGKPNENN